MKKSLIALAVAGVVSAPAFAATSNVDIYGVLSYSVDQVDTDNTTVGNDASDLATGVNNVSRIGFKGSEDLGGGMKAVFQIETSLTGWTDRNTFVGLSSGMGTVVLGRHDTPYKLATVKLDPFVDTMADYNAIIGRSSGVLDTAMFDVRAPQTIAYISPTIGGFHAAVAYISYKAVETTGLDETTGLSAMGMYENGPFFASLAYESHEGGLNTLLGSAAGGITSSDAMKLGLGFTMGTTKLGFVWEDQSVEGTSLQDHKAYYLSLSHGMGPISLKAAYGKADDGEGVAVDNSATFWALGADYAMSKRTTAYLIYTSLDNDGTGTYGLKGYNAIAATGVEAGSNSTGLSIGIKHSF